MAITRLIEPRVKLPPIPQLPMPSLKPIGCRMETCQDLSAASDKEWLVTNGLGGWASSTITGMNTRLTHGLLVVALHPPFSRVLLLSKVEETLISPLGRYELSTNRYASGVVHPEGFRYLVEFRLDPAPTFFYRIGETLLEKSIFLLPGENAVVVGYTLHASPRPVELAVRPLMAFRDFRTPVQEAQAQLFLVEEGVGTFTVRGHEGFPPLMIQHTAELLERSPCWYKSFEYTEPEAGPAKFVEDLWSPGQLLYLLKAGESCAFVASTGRRGGVDIIFHERRLMNTQTVLAQTVNPPGKGPLTARLSWTAENFLAAAEKSAYLMAGFPEMTSWGRDALIALPGLALATHRWDAARSVLETLISKVKDGLLPVRFNEEDGAAEYDSADTSLWFFWTLWHYMRTVKDRRFFLKKLLPVCREILEGYLEGTHFGIGMGEDGLIALSDEELPLTWMDGRLPGRQGVLGRAVTPRFGKPVEVNALWYCALRIMAHYAQDLGSRRTLTYTRLARLIQQNFQKAFCAPSGVLYDRVTDKLKDTSIRPNMLIAASLPFSPLTRAQKEVALDTVERILLTPAGIRTLSPSDPNFRGRYEGDASARALAYHQGTVWTWLMGPYVSTVLKVRGPTRATKEALKKQLSFFLPHLEERGMGTLSEIFDGDSPHAARGGVSQAWAVGEILRAIQEADLGNL